MVSSTLEIIHLKTHKHKIYTIIALRVSVLCNFHLGKLLAWNIETAGEFIFAGVIVYKKTDVTEER
jgi:hypothetical protein